MSSDAVSGSGAGDAIFALKSMLNFNGNLLHVIIWTTFKLCSFVLKKKRIGCICLAFNPKVFIQQCFPQALIAGCADRL